MKADMGLKRTISGRRTIEKGKIMKVLLLSPIPPPSGGIARWSQTVINDCNKDPSIQLYHVNIGSGTKDVVNRSFFQRFVVQLFRIITIRAKVKHIIKEHHVDIAHITTSGDYGVVRDFILSRLFVRLKVRYVYHLHFGHINGLKKANDIRYKMMARVMEII